MLGGGRGGRKYGGQVGEKRNREQGRTDTGQGVSCIHGCMPPNNTGVCHYPTGNLDQGVTIMIKCSCTNVYIGWNFLRAEWYKPCETDWWETSPPTQHCGEHAMSHVYCQYFHNVCSSCRRGCTSKVRTNPYHRLIIKRYELIRNTAQVRCLYRHLIGTFHRVR